MVTYNEICIIWIVHYIILTKNWNTEVIWNKTCGKRNAEVVTDLKESHFIQMWFFLMWEHIWYLMWNIDINHIILEGLVNVQKSLWLCFQWKVMHVHVFFTIFLFVGKFSSSSCRSLFVRKSYMYFFTIVFFADELIGLWKCTFFFN